MCPPDNNTDDDSSFESASDADSALSSLSQSVTSSILNGKFENGRRYHAFREGAYLLPEDEKEQDRLDLMAHCYNLVLEGELYRAPIKNPQLVLDLGTGTGIWALDVADEHPEAQVIGTDLSPIQPAWTAPNCRFLIDDAEADWVFQEKGSFDLIHERYLYAGIKDWDKLWQQSYEHLRPGGWVESHEHAAWFDCDDEGFAESQTMFWQRKVTEATDKMGMRFNIAHEQKERMIKAGFVNVTQEVVEAPVGTWDKSKKELGKAALLNVLEGIEPTSLAVFSRVLGWEPVQCQALTTAVKNEFLKNKHRVYFKFYITYGQKPEEERAKDA